MELNDKCPITKQIDNMDETIKELNERIGKLIYNGAESKLILDLYLICINFSAALERKLKFLMPDSIERKALTQELIEIKKLVGTHENRLKELRKNNRKSFFFCAFVIFLIFLLYSSYVLWQGY